MVEEIKKVNGSGCFISTCVGVFLITLGVLLAAGVGVIVYFTADGRDLVCKCDSYVRSIADTAAIMGKCKGLAESGNSEICSKCPTTTGLTTSPSPPTITTPDTPPLKEVRDVRLPKSVIPIHYNLRIQPYMYQGEAKDFYFKGSVRIVVQCLEPTNNVILHVNNMTVGAVRFQASNPTSSDPRLLDTEEDKEREFFILRLSHNMQKNKQYEVLMNYTSSLAPSLLGFYLTSYTRSNNAVSYAASTQFEPTNARRALPCFDEPSLKATFNITVVRKQDLFSLSNSPIQRTSDPWTEDGITYVADTYEQTPSMSTYLLAFVVCDFQHTSGVASNGVRIRAFARPDLMKNSTLHALNVGLEVLPYFEKYFNTIYPLPKEDMIAFPKFTAGAMENWGLINYAELSMLLTPGVSTEKNREQVTLIVSHELAHQWFGNLVSPAWWDDLWLNEGFATFIQYLGMGKVYPRWNIWEKFVANDLQKALYHDGHVTSHPVFVPVSLPHEISEIFDSISYSKGGAIIRMMRHFLGFETFRKGLVRYLQKRKYDSVVDDDLWTALEEQVVSEGKDIRVREIMETWTLQMNYPVVTVTRDFNDLGRVHVTQQRFLFNYHDRNTGRYESKFGYKWNIPITITTSRNPNFVQNDTDVHWMYKNETNKYLNMGINNLPVPGDENGWILCNTEQNGFYRVNYQVGNWKNLFKQLNNNHLVIPVINRAQIINDAWNLEKGHLIGMDIALNSTSYLSKEMAYLPWKTAKGDLNYVGRMLSLTSTYGMFQRYMREITSGPFGRYTLDNSGASHVDAMARTEIATLACTYDVDSCTSQAVGQYRQWMSNSNYNRIDPNLKSIVYCTAIRHGDWDEWNFALKMYGEAKTKMEQALLLGAMACSNKSWILNHFMTLTLKKNSPILKQDILTVIGNVASSTIGHSLAWQFFREHFDQISEDFSGSISSWEKVASQLTESFNTIFHISTVGDFITSIVSKHEAAYDAFRGARDDIVINIRWMDDKYPTVHAWFADKYNN